MTYSSFPIKVDGARSEIQSSDEKLLRLMEKIFVHLQLTNKYLAKILGEEFGARDIKNQE